jgi:hypothetical protein
LYIPGTVLRIGVPVLELECNKWRLYWRHSFIRAEIDPSRARVLIPQNGSGTRNNVKHFLKSPRCTNCMWHGMPSNIKSDAAVFKFKPISRIKILDEDDNSHSTRRYNHSINRTKLERFLPLVRRARIGAGYGSAIKSGDDLRNYVPVELPHHEGPLAAPHLQTQFWHPAIAMSFCTHSSAICIQSYGKFMVQLWHIFA